MSMLPNGGMICPWVIDPPTCRLFVVWTSFAWSVPVSVTSAMPLSTPSIKVIGVSLISLPSIEAYAEMASIVVGTV
jgi:hypothetical protein